MAQARKSVIRSFRLDESVLQRLEEEAKRRNVSTNTLMNQIVSGFVNFDRYFEKLGLMKIAHPTFSHLLQSASEEEVIDAGRNAGRDVPKAIISAKQGSMTLYTAIDFLRMMGDYANLYKYSEIGEGGVRTLTLMHELGPKGSLFLIHYAGGVLEQVGIRAKYSSTDHSVTIEF
ncbi:MAG: hypothetical protein JRN11_06300 [Nitrososphaerota archaeon]|nr:hypothetical protein [Nitrososphaerota archaeon]MDG7026342.1 hypothetical protein [Nitrososphaerota archaeon]